MAKSRGLLGLSDLLLWLGRALEDELGETGCASIGEDSGLSESVLVVGGSSFCFLKIEGDRLVMEERMSDFSFVFLW